MIFLMLAPICAIAASDVEFTNQMLDSEIERLTQQRDEKFAALQKCEETTKGFKIAGITTLAVTGVGVYGNIKLSQKLQGKGSKKSGSGGGSVLVDNSTEEEKVDSLCKSCDTDPNGKMCTGLKAKGKCQ